MVRTDDLILDSKEHKVIADCLSKIILSYLLTTLLDYALALYIIHVMCALIISEWRNLKFKAESEPQILMELVIPIFGL